jgi:hypothetical protein
MFSVRRAWMVRASQAELNPVTNADLFVPPPEPPGTYDDMPWQLRRFVTSICDMRQAWMITPPVESMNDETE